jgi:hypothetical protein
LGTRPFRAWLGVRSLLLAAPENQHYAKGIAPVPVQKFKINSDSNFTYVAHVQVSEKLT